MTSHTEVQDRKRATWAQQAEANRRKRAAQMLLESRRERLIRSARRALLRRLLDRDRASADDVREMMDLPSGVNPVCLGAVPGRLARLGLIGRVGYVDSRRPDAHARPVSVWGLIDRAGAVAWLATHPEPPEPDQDGTLFDLGNAAASVGTLAGQ